jgi:hypothetical protein
VYDDRRFSDQGFEKKGDPDLRKSFSTPAILFACVLIATMLTPVALSAEINSGIKVGGSSTELGGLPLDSRTGISAGVFGVYDWTRFLGLDLGIQVEGLYSQKGATDLLIHYLEFPFLARINVPIGGLGIHILAGPVFAFQQNCSDCEIPLKTPDIEGMLGAGIDLGVGSSVFTVEARYAKSLSNINDSTSPPTDVLELKNQGFGLTVGYSRRFGGPEESGSEEPDTESPD